MRLVQGVDGRGQGTPEPGRDRQLGGGHGELGGRRQVPGQLGERERIPLRLRKQQPGAGMGSHARNGGQHPLGFDPAQPSDPDHFSGRVGRLWQRCGEDRNAGLRGDHGTAERVQPIPIVHHPQPAAPARQMLGEQRHRRGQRKRGDVRRVRPEEPRERRRGPGRQRARLVLHRREQPLQPRSGQGFVAGQRPHREHGDPGGGVPGGGLGEHGGTAGSPLAGDVHRAPAPESCGGPVQMVRAPDQGHRRDR